MRHLGLLAAGILCGALAVSGQDGERGDALDREIARLQALLRERIQEKAPPPEQQVTLRMYDVVDLCTELREHLQPLENLTPSKYQSPEAEMEPEPRPVFQIDMLIEMIKTGIEPESWEMEGADIQPKNGLLFVRAIPRVHGKVERLLQWCRTCADRRVSVEIAVVRVGDGDKGLLSGALELSAEEAQRLSQDPLGAVTLAGFDAQRLGGRVGREISYVEDYDVKIAEKAVVGDPIRGTVFAGASAEVRACLDDGQGAVLHCQLELSRVAEPIPVHPTEHGGLELPEKRLTRVQASFWAPLGRTVVAGACTVGEDPCAILVTVRRR